MRNAIYEDMKLYELLDNAVKTEKSAELLIAAKRKWRKWLRQQDERNSGWCKNGRYLILNGGGDFDYYWQKLLFPGQKWYADDKKRFIEENWVYAEPSQYDCTGQWFTSWIRCFNVPAGVVVYVRMDCDV